MSGEKIMPYESLFKAISFIESSNNPLAIGDLHLEDNSYGIVQIRQSRLDDYFRQTGIRYSVTDMFDPMKAKEVFMFYASKYQPSDIESISSSWNGGPNWREKKSTIEYFLKVKSKIATL